MQSLTELRSNMHLNEMSDNDDQPTSVAFMKVRTMLRIT
jgi:hypothetical protein